MLEEAIRLKMYNKQNHFSRAARLGKCTCIFLLLFLPLFAKMVLAEGIVEVTIQGIDKRLYDNVAATLKIYQNREDEGLSDRAVKRMHRGAEKEIKKALEPFGYYSPIIKSELSKNEDGWNASYLVDVGEPVRVTNVEISIETEADPPDEIVEITPMFPLKKGAVLDHALYNSGKKLLLRKLIALGFMQAEYVRNEIKVDRLNKSGEIILFLRTGPRFLFGETNFNQDLIDPKLLKRYVQYRVGDPYSPRKVIELQRQLYKTNYFGQVVIKGEVEEAEDLHVPISVTLSKPQFFNRYSLGLGYATDNGFRGTIGWDNRLLNRRGHTLSSELQLAQRESSLNFMYGVPVMDPRFDKVLYGGTYEDQTWDDTDTRLLRAGLEYKHDGNRYKYGAGFELRDEKYQVGVTEGESFLPVSKVNLTMVFADDPINTSHGIIVSGDVKGASEYLFGDTTFLQGKISGKAIVSPLDGFRLIGRFSFGATFVDSIDDLPPSLRFYAGGDQSVRGYGYKTLGPTDSSGTVIGGRYLFFGSIEAEKVVSGNWSLAAFFDTGNAMNEISDDIAAGAGVGVRYRLPFGQVRVDVASALSEEGNPLRLHFTVGGDL